MPRPAEQPDIWIRSLPERIKAGLGARNIEINYITAPLGPGPIMEAPDTTATEEPCP